MNRVTKESNGTVIKGQYTYNAYNKVATETNGNSEITYGYDSASGLIANSYSKVGTDTVLTMYFYDSKYNCTNISFGKVDSKGNFSDIHRQQFTYDTENRLKTVAENYNEGSYVTVATYTYDSNGNVSKTALGNGVSTTYAYDKANNLTTLTNTNSAGTISKYTYTYLPDGNVSKKTESTGKVTTYTYDNLNRLKTEAITGTTNNISYAYAYDKSGNRSSLAVTGAETYTTTYSYDKNNRLLEDQTYRPNEGVTDINTYVYDKNGNQLRKYASQSLDENGTTAISAGSLTDTDFNVEIYGYNAFNQLISYKDSDGTTASYTYLANGLRDSKTVDGTTTYFLWNGTNILADFDENSNFTNVYSRGLQLIKNDSNTYYTFNGHGDVTSLTNSSGTVTKTYDYDAFGVEINKSDTDTNPFRYCGEYFDKETDTIYLRARYYSPSTGRFTTEDPIRSGLNWYAYCSSNPIRYIDPNGLTDITGNPYVRKIVEEFNFYASKINLNLEYNSSRNYYYFPSNSIQGAFGYNDLYDKCGELVGMDLDTVIITYTYDNTEYRLQLWKGNYFLNGDTVFDVIGAEVGLYSKDVESELEHYYAVTDDDRINVKFTLMDSAENILIKTDGTDPTWWENAFKIYVDEEHNGLTLAVTMTYQSTEKRDAAYDAAVNMDGMRVTKAGDYELSIKWE